MVNLAVLPVPHIAGITRYFHVAHLLINEYFICLYTHFQRMSNTMKLRNKTRNNPLFLEHIKYFN